MHGVRDASVKTQGQGLARRKNLNDDQITINNTIPLRNRVGLFYVSGTVSAYHFAASKLSPLFLESTYNAV
jgi:hypothetical protein